MYCAVRWCRAFPRTLSAGRWKTAGWDAESGAEIVSGATRLSLMVEVENSSRWHAALRKVNRKMIANPLFATAIALLTPPNRSSGR
jgi:hypothetical protein